MPVYEFKCASGHWFDRYLKLAVYDQQQSCQCGQPAVKQVSAPFVRADLPSYRSPIDGRWIDGKAQRREDLRKSGSIEYDPEMGGEFQRKRQQAEQREEAAIDETLDAQIAAMPARKLELLEQEVRAGASAEVVRAVPQT